MKYLITLFTLLLFSSCNEKTAKLPEVQNEHHEEHGHVAPNGGVLTDVGDHSASIEWLIEEGLFKLYIFDGCAEKPIRIAQKEMQVTMMTDAEKQITLTPVTNKLTGEKPGDANTFSAEVKNLSKDKIFNILVHSVTIQGIDYENIKLELE